MSSPEPEFTPWFDKKELLRVRGWLYYVPWAKNPDNRRQACSLVRAWKLRGNLPHAVESTALLTQATLVDDPKALNFTVIQLAYSSAFCRFVTGLLDSDRNARRRISMHEKARQLGFPAALVDLRHDITHEDIPSLETLRLATKRSLQWLWNDYWIKLTPIMPPDQPEALKDDLPVLKERFRTILRGYFREAYKAKKPNDGKEFLVPGHVADKPCLDLVKICENHEAVVTELAVVMLECKLLVPASRKLHQPMDDFFPYWDPIVKKLSAHQQCFLDLLIDQMAIQITYPTPMDVTVDEYREAITMWLERIFVSKVYSAAVKRAKINHYEIVLTGIYNANFWTIRLLRCIMAAPQHKIIKELFAEKLEEIWRKFGGGKPHSQEGDGTTPVRADEGEEEGGWKRAKNWVPKPFGMV